jgi:hypothetical protein
MKSLVARLSIFLTLGMLLPIACSLAPAIAQSGNQSDATGPINSTGDFNGRYIPGPASSPTSFSGGESSQTAVNQTATSLNEQLNVNTFTLANGTSPTPSVQQALLSVLTGDAGAKASAEILGAALASAPGSPSPATIQALLASLEGVATDNQVDASKLLATVQDYNAMIRASNEEFLRQPPVELLALRDVLTRLVTATAR